MRKVRNLLEKIINDKKVFIPVMCSLILIIVICGIGIFLLATSSGGNDLKPGEEQLVMHADFDKDTNGFTTEAWNPGNGFTYLDNGGLENSGCVMVSNFDANDARYRFDVEVEENSYYKISGWIKTADIEQTGNAAGANISVLHNFETYEYVYGTTDWTYVEFYGETADGQDTLPIALRVGFYSGENVGTAWFDDIKVHKVADIPENVECLNFKDTLSQSSDASEDEELPLDENFYEDMTKGAVILSFFVLLSFVIAFRYARAYDGIGRKVPLTPPCGEPMSLGKALVAVFIIGIIIRIVLALTPLQCSGDVNIFKYWGDMSVSEGFTDTYITLKDSIDYPPLYVYVLYAASWIKDLFADSGYQDIIYSLLIKMTPIIADCIIGLFIYKICNKKMRTEWKVFAVAAWLLNPVVIIDSAVWGQVDSVLALFVLLSVYYGYQKKFLWSGLWLGIGVMLKPQAIIVSPIIFFMLVKYFIQEKEELKKKFAGLGFTVMGFMAGAVIPCIPFMFKMGMVETEILGKSFDLPWIFSLFIGTANGYSYASVNSLNFWFLMGKNWITDSAEIWNITILTWGFLAIIAICLVIWILYILFKNKNYLPYLFAGLLYLFVTMFGPRMHERYFFPAVAFFAVAFVLSNNRIWLWMYTLLSVFGFLTITEVLLDLEVGKYLQRVTADPSRYGQFLWVKQSAYRDTIAWVMLGISVVVLVLIVLEVFNVIGKKCKFERIWNENGTADDIVKNDGNNLVENNAFCLEDEDSPLLSLDFGVVTEDIAIEVSQESEIVENSDTDVQNEGDSDDEK